MSLWTLFALSINTISIFVVYYECAFRMRAFDKFSAFSVIIELVLVLELIIFFFKAYPAKEPHKGWIFALIEHTGLCRKSEDE